MYDVVRYVCYVQVSVVSENQGLKVGGIGNNGTPSGTKHL